MKPMTAVTSGSLIASSMRFLGTCSLLAWLALPASGTGHDKPVKVDGQSMRCVCVLRAAVASAMGGEGE